MGAKRIDLTPEQKEQALTMFSAGDRYQTVCEAIGIKPDLLFAIFRREPDFYKQAQIARQNGVHLKVERLETVYDGCETLADAAIARGISDNIKWVASKISPETYGERIDVNIKATVDLAKVLEAANNRALPYIQAERNVTPILPSHQTQCVEPKPNVEVDFDTSKPQNE